jgi:ABC-type branched-subunit amino acid transport system ATPase component
MATAILNPDGVVGVPVGLARRAVARVLPNGADAEAEGREAVRGCPLPQRLPHRGLHVANLSVRYGRIEAVDDVALAVGAGEIVGLIGPNGAGKTSLVDGVTGFAAASGTVLLDGKDIVGLASHMITRAGLARTFQGDELLAESTVLENVTVGAAARRPAHAVAMDLFRPTVAPPPEPAMTALEFVGLSGDAMAPVASLDPRRRKLVGLARALAQEPKVLVVDEPAAGLDSHETGELADLLVGIAARGIGVLLIDHDMDLISALVDRLVVMEHGRVIAEGAPEDVLRLDRVVGAYLGATGVQSVRAISAGA